MNVAVYLIESIKKYGKCEQFIYVDHDKEVVITNTQVDSNSRAVAGGLKSFGAEKGDIIGVMVSNIKEIPELINGIMRMGSVFMPISPWFSPDEIRYILEDSKTRILIIENSMLLKLTEAFKGNTTVQKLVVLEAQNSDGSVWSYEDFTRQDIDSGEVVDLERDQLAMLVYTLSVTGPPRGVMLSHYNLISSMLAGRDVWPSDRMDRFYITIPMSNIYGCLFFFEALFNGSYLFLVPRFDPLRTLDIITHHKITVMPLVPTMIIAMMEKYNPNKHDLQSMKRSISVGTPIAEDTLTKAGETFGIRIYNCYGLAEAGSTVTRQRPNRLLKIRSVGSPIPSLEVKLVDHYTGKEMKNGETGEIIVKGGGIMQGYLNKPKETAEVLRGGWLYTGVLGRFDTDGDLYIVGHTKDLIMKGGEIIDPRIPEKILYKHPAVLAAAVIGIPDKKYGEEVAAVVVLRHDYKATEEELLGYLGNALHHFAIPKRIFFMDSFPQTEVGKILKSEIKKIILEKL
jgi:long-chain acyl-CoA synthetase